MDEINHEWHEIYTGPLVILYVNIAPQRSPHHDTNFLFFMVILHHNYITDPCSTFLTGLGQGTSPIAYCATLLRLYALNPRPKWDELTDSRNPSQQCWIIYFPAVQLRDLAISFGPILYTTAITSPYILVYNSASSRILIIIYENKYMNNALIVTKNC